MLQTREESREQVGRERRDYSELQGTGEDFAVPREIDEVARGGENALGSLGHFDSCCGQRDFAGPAFDQPRADLALQFPDLH